MPATIIEHGSDLEMDVVPSGKSIFVGDILPVSNVLITERCLAACNYCGIDAKSNGRHMQWELFNAITGSDSIAFLRKQRIYLGDGEVLIYQDEQHAKTLVDVIKMLVFDLDLKVGFTTAGLIGPNREIGLNVLEQLTKFGLEFKKNIHSSLSVNISHPHVNSIEEYAEQMLETILLLEKFSQVCLITMSSPETSEKFQRLIGALFERLGRFDKLSVSPRSVSPWHGRAILNYSHLRSSKDSEKEDIGSCESLDSKPANLYSIKSNGDVSTGCSGFGIRGTSFGNIFENDARQIHENYRQFLTEFRERVGSEDRRVSVCEAHRTWNKRYVSPKSDHPVVRRALACSRS
jgi:MoaA/NifB/PqqE/SkfB family radical SAM enzyme